MTEYANAGNVKKTNVPHSKTAYESPQKERLADPLNNVLLRQSGNIRQLQRTIGNQRVMRLLSSSISVAPRAAIQRGLEGGFAEMYRNGTMSGGPYRAVTLKIDLSKTNENLKASTQWWMSDAHISELRSANGEAIKVTLEDGDGDGYGVTLSLNDISFEEKEHEKKAKAKQEAIEKRKNDSTVQGQFAKAMKEHETDRAAVDAVLEGAAESGDTLLKNSAQLVAAGVVPIHVLTPTHDSAERVEIEGAGEDKHAIFPSTIGESTPAEPYRWYDPADQYNVLFNPKLSAGMNVAGEADIYLVNPSKWSSMEVTTTIAGTIKHEVQHAVDMNKRGGDEPGWRQFKTEYRAYLAAGEHADKDDTKTDQVLNGVGGFTARQKAIAEHILANYEDAKKAWDNNILLKGLGKPFRDAVVTFRGSLNDLSINPINSPRLLEFQEAVRAINPNANLAAQPVKNLIAQFFTTQGATPLDANDKAVVAGGGALKALMLEQLHPVVYQQLVTLAKPSG